jgi:hypothetical protein
METSWTVTGWCITEQIIVLLSENLVRKTNALSNHTKDILIKNLHQRIADHENSVRQSTILCVCVEVNVKTNDRLALYWPSDSKGNPVRKQKWRDTVKCILMAILFCLKKDLLLSVQIIKLEHQMLVFFLTVSK